VTTLTGIPIEVLFAIIGALGMIIYADVKHDLRRLRRASSQRGKSLVYLASILEQVCDKMHIKFRAPSDNEDD
jgi:hypothetical protein